MWKLVEVLIDLENEYDPICGYLAFKDHANFNFNEEDEENN